MFGGGFFEVFLDARAPSTICASSSLPAEPPLHVHAAFFVDEQRRALRLGRPLRCGDQEQVRRLHAAAAAGERERCERCERRRQPHARTAAPPRRGSPAPLRAPSRRSAAWTPPKNRFSAPKRRPPAAPGRVASSSIARLGVDDAVLEVHARRAHGLARAEAAVDDADDRLQQRRADAVGARAAEHQLDLAVAQHDRRRHHARHPPPGRVPVEAERVEVLLAHHVVEVDARCRARPRPSPRRSCR